MRLPSSASSPAGRRSARATGPAPTSGSASAPPRQPDASAAEAPAQLEPSRRGPDARPTSFFPSRTRLTMTALALMIRPTGDGWGVYLTNGQELVRYRGIGSKWRAAQYLRRIRGGGVVQEATQHPRPAPST